MQNICITSGHNEPCLIAFSSFPNHRSENLWPRSNNQHSQHIIESVADILYWSVLHPMARYIRSPDRQGGTRSSRSTNRAQASKLASIRIHDLGWSDQRSTADWWELCAGTINRDGSCRQWDIPVHTVIGYLQLPPATHWRIARLCNGHSSSAPGKSLSISRSHLASLIWLWLS